MARPPNNRTRFRRLEIIVDASPAASTASIPLVHINNLDSAGNIWSGGIDTLEEVFRRLGFETAFSYSPPTTGA